MAWAPTFKRSHSASVRVIHFQMPSLSMRSFMGRPSTVRQYSQVAVAPSVHSIAPPTTMRPPRDESLNARMLIQSLMKQPAVASLMCSVSVCVQRARMLSCGAAAARKNVPPHPAWFCSLALTVLPA